VLEAYESSTSKRSEYESAAGRSRISADSDDGDEDNANDIVGEGRGGNEKRGWEGSEREELES
jgi:hypothetical protein